MAQYTIEDTTLTALGDAVRGKTGMETRIEYKEYIETFDIHLEVLDQFRYYFPAGTREVGVEILSRNMKMPHYKYDASDNYKYIYDLDYAESTAVRNVNDGDYFSIFNSKSSAFTGTYKFTCRDENGRVITEEKEVKNTMTPETMISEINNLVVGEISNPIIEVLNVTENGTYTPPDGVDGFCPVYVNVASSGGDLPEEALTITGDCSYRFANNGWNWFLNQYGRSIKTKDIDKGAYMFYFCRDLEQVPFDINIKAGNSNSIEYMFYQCNKLKNIPKIKGLKAKEMANLFNSCLNLREITEDFYEDWDWSLHDNSTSAYGATRNNMFDSCYSLRKYPNSFLAHGNPVGTYTQSMYNSLFRNCYSLDEVIDLPVQHRNAAWSGSYSNAFANMVNTCCRLKNFTFETNEDGSPIVIGNWAQQVIDFSQGVGYAAQIYIANNITSYNSGITVDKKVTDDASYQALKNDPDWFTTDINYARYNHDSAVATINSLPDVSAKTGNTIKFKGTSGALTDGGAINTMTEEEIAVATAKGWTVTFA